MNDQSKALIALFCTLFLLIPSLAFAQDAKGDKDDKKLFIDTGVTTNYVEHGITQSENSWALNSSFGYKMGSSARLGLSGSSVQFPDGGENLNIRLFFDVKVNITPANNLVLRYDFNRYFESSSHNGGIVLLDDSFVGYHMKFEQNTNWDGTGSPSTWYGFSKEFALPYSLSFEPEFGYNQLSAPGYSNYFDSRLSLSADVIDIHCTAAFTFNSDSSQFGNRGKNYFILSASVHF